jgi:DNA-binding HxlR family transcriptional regulator
MAVESLGDRWSLLVLRDIMFGNRRHFRELLAGSEEGIASNILAHRLRHLTDAGLLTRAQAGQGQRASYSLTEPAIQLVPILTELGAWGVRHRPTTPELAVRARLLADGGRPMQERFMDELREVHLGIPAPAWGGPSVGERLAQARRQAAQTVSS